MAFLETSNTTMYYDIFEPDITSMPLSAQPQTVLLIHGFGGTPTSDFGGQLPALRGHYRVIAPHLHGYGSDGGIAGLLLAALHPQRVIALAVMGAQPAINAQNTAAIRHWLLEAPLSEEWQKELAQLHGEPYWRSLPRMYVEGQEALVAAGGVIITDKELASIRCPALLMHGKRDRIVPAGYAQILSERIPGSQLLLFDAGHAAHLRCEQEYTSAVMNFFLNQTRPADETG